jgi:hypothetical protein
VTSFPSIEFVDAENPELHRTIQDGVRSYNLTLFPNHPEGKDLVLAWQGARFVAVRRGGG